MKGLKFIHLNCRSLYKKVAQLSVITSDYDFICCSETWLSSAYPNSLISIHGKSIFRTDRSTRGGGVCIYVDNKISPYCTIDAKSSFCNSDIEIISLDVKKPGMKYMKVSSVYRPPRGDHKKCINALTEILSRHENSKYEIFILGDFNVDFLKRADINFKRFQNFFKTYGLTQLIEGITRPAGKVGTCIDWIITNSRFIFSANITDIFISDHFAVDCVKKKHRESVKTVIRDVRDYKNYNCDDFITLVKTKVNLTEFSTVHDPDYLWNSIYLAIIDILAVMCPYRRYRQREYPSPWMCAEIYRAIRYRDRLIALYKSTRANLYLSLARSQRNVVNSMIESAKKLYIANLLTKNSGCPKKFWKNINGFLKGNKPVPGSVRFIDQGTQEHIPFGQEADFLNDYYCNISQRLGINDDVPDRYPDDYLGVYDNIVTTFDLCDDLPTIGEVVLHAESIDSSKSSCVEGISTSVCKDLLTYVPGYFLHIFKSSILKGIFPRDWANGLITVIPKTGKASDPANWRPITQTSIFAKIFEKIIHNRVASYFVDNQILSQYQYGFRKGKSTQEAIFDLVKFIYSALNHKKLVGAVCLDVSKAFDCIDHNILLQKMAKIGFTGSSLKWFESYLVRTQTVRFDGNISAKLNVKTGIGQGTILGPLIFIFYVNDLISVMNNFKVNMYADDCILFSSGNDWKKMISKMQPELDKIHEWCLHNRLQINVKKSKSILIGSRTKLSNVDYTKLLKLGNNTLQFVDKYKYLGTTLDKEMNLTALLSDVKKSVLSKLFVLRKLRPYVTEKCAIAIYKQTILPVFDYVGFMLISCNKSDRNDLQIIQNDALRTCYNVRRRDRLTVSSMHNRSHLLSLEQRRIIQLLCLMYIHRRDPANLKIPVRNTREADRDIFKVERYKNCKYKNSPYYKGADIWKSLPLDISDSDCMFQFKKGIKRIYKKYNNIYV